MRTFLLLCFSTVFGFSPNNTLSQNAKIEIEKDKTITVVEIFEMIQEQTNYKFIYNDELILKAPKVDVTKGSVLVKSLLHKGLNPVGCGFEFTETNTIIVRKNKVSFKPKESILFKVEGIVTDVSGEPLPGASVLEKGAKNGTSTDFDGKFSLEVVNENAILEVSYIGFATKLVSLKGKSFVKIQLKEDAAELEEIVVVGYGTTKKANLTGSIDQIDATQLGDRANQSIISSLQGSLPGLNIQSSNGDPRANSEINVRGFNSINGGSPLVLIDGIEGNINLLNPLDIKNVTVLKDAASAAIYGARGAFGVILVTTKKGVEGDVKIEYNHNVSISTPVARTDYISDPVLYGRTVDKSIGGYNGSTLTGYTSEEDWNRLQQVADGVVAPWRELQADGTYKFYDNTDWYRHLFKKNTLSKIHNISLSGGSEKLKTYLSARYFNTETVQNLRDEDINKYNLKANVSLKVTDWLEISDNIQYNSGNEIEYGGRAKGWGTNWTYANNYLYAFHPTNIDGEAYDNRGQSTHAAIEEGNNFQTYEYKEFVNTISAKLNPINDLQVNFDYSNRFTNSIRKTRLNEFDFLTGNDLSLRTGGLNRLTELSKEKVYTAINLYGTYSKSIQDNHNFKLLLGYNQEHFDQEDVLAEQGGLFDPNFSNLNLGTEILRADGSSQIWAIQGYFGRFNYNFKNKYLLELNARYDGSSRFPKESRWGLFPSASLGWEVGKENFWESIKPTVGTLKLRASYGELGNQNVGLYTFSELLPIGQSTWLTDGAELSTVGAASPLPKVVTWEKSATLNFGADLGLFRNRLTASVDVYQKEVTDMYLPGEPLPGVFGASSPNENNADLRVKGFEVSLAYRNKFTVKGSPLNFKATLNVNNSVAKITKYSNPEGLLSDFYEGQTLGEIWGYRVDGQFQSDEVAAAYQNSFDSPSSSLSSVYNYAINVAQNGEWKGLKAGDLKYLDIDGDGRIDKGNNTLEDHGDLEVIGNALPKLPFGFSFSADYKGFDLFMSGSGVVSQDWYPNGRLYWGTYERPYVAFIRKDLVSDAWSPENTGGRFPQIERGYSSLSSNRQLSAVNDHFIENIGYVRVKNLTLGYTIPKDVTEKFHIDRVRFYLSGENLFTYRFGGLTKYLDPEQAGSGVSLNDPNGATSSSNVEDYPIVKTYSFGISLTL